MRIAIRSSRLTVALAAAVGLLAGCPDREVSAVDPNPVGEQQQYIPVSINRDIDILFVIDDSGSMAQEQQVLGGNFVRFIEVLQSIEGGLPNIHLGVASSNVGTDPGGGGGTACDGNGDNGVLQVDGTKLAGGGHSGCPALTGGRYIEDISTNPDDQTQRQRNYTGDLAAQFSCMAQIGNLGCGFEQHLEGMRRALDNNNENAGFLRDNAFLAVIFLQDEDDCSAKDRAVFDETQDDRNAPLGEISSFRCFEFGTTCEPAAERELGPRQNCVSGDDDTDYLHLPSFYVDFLKGLKSDPAKVIVAAIAAPTEPVNVSIDPNRDQLWVEPACVICPNNQPPCSISFGDDGAALVAAAPGIRIREFVDSFPQRSTYQNICSWNPDIGQVDFSGALIQIANLLKLVIGSPCIGGNLAMPLDCRVSDVANYQQPGQVEYPIPSCEDSGGSTPCWTMTEDASKCADTPTHLILDVNRGGGEAPDNTTVVVKCLLD